MFFLLIHFLHFYSFFCFFFCVVNPSSFSVSEHQNTVSNRDPFHLCPPCRSSPLEWVIFFHSTESTSQGTMEDTSHQWVVGLRVAITTLLDEYIEGEIFTFDTITNCVVLMRKRLSIPFIPK